MKIVWIGATRIVIVFDKVVIKIPRLFKVNTFYGKTVSILEGWLANRNEYIWEKSNIYDFLCPIKLSLFWSFIIVMSKVELLNDVEFNKLNKEDYNFGGIEWKLDSFGKLNNKIVAIDYGN